ncbi:hypothetical protein J1N35_022589, partial [Gossypium stocksii]
MTVPNYGLTIPAVRDFPPGCKRVTSSNYGECVESLHLTNLITALDLSRQEVKWLRNLLAKIPIWEKPVPLVSLLCDSQVTTCVANNQSYNGKKRHIRIRHESVRHLIKNKVLALEYMRSKRNIVDPLTKGLRTKMVLDASNGMV